LSDPFATTTSSLWRCWHTQGVHNRAEQLRIDLEIDLTAQQIDAIRSRVQAKTLDALVQELLDAL
jgi:hypothetical protein